MDKIIWNDSFSVGVTYLDQQHRKIIGMVNQLIECRRDDVRSETVSEILSQMMEYAREHFRNEEKILAEHEYPELDSHRIEHKTFLRDATKFCLDTMDGISTIPHDILEYLYNWWLEHILQSDMQYKDFLLQRGCN